MSEMQQRKEKKSIKYQQDCFGAKEWTYFWLGTGEGMRVFIGWRWGLVSRRDGVKATGPKPERQSGRQNK